MGVLKIVLFGRIPSKKNSKNWIFRGGRKFLVPSANYMAWHQEQSLKLKKNLVSSPIEKCSLVIKICFPDNRSADLTNKAESIMDFLVDSKILFDDKHQICHDIHLISIGIDKIKPRAEITINYEDNITTT